MNIEKKYIRSTLLMDEIPKNIIMNIIIIRNVKFPYELIYVYNISLYDMVILSNYVYKLFTFTYTGMCKKNVNIIKT